jgi:hypothetical protein
MTSEFAMTDDGREPGVLRSSTVEIRPIIGSPLNWNDKARIVGSMVRKLIGIGPGLGGLRRIESHAVAAVALAFTVLSLIGETVTDDLRWAVVMAGIGLLVHRGAAAETRPSAHRLLADRREFEETPLQHRLRTAQEVWVFAPSGANMLSSPHCDALRRYVLNREYGAVHVVVLDPNATETVARTAHWFSDSLDFSSRKFTQSLDAVIGRLEAMARWPHRGEFSYRLLDHNPGFSLVAIDPAKRTGTLIVEFHAVHNESSAARMHLTLTRSISAHWYSYWMDQFQHIWRNAAEPAPSTGIDRRPSE